MLPVIEVLLLLLIVYLGSRWIIANWKKKGVEGKLDEVKETKDLAEKVKVVDLEEVKQQKRSIKDFEDL